MLLRLPKRNDIAHPWAVRLSQLRLPQARISLKRECLVLGLFAIVAVLLTWPAAVATRGHVVGVFDFSNDLEGTLWNQWFDLRCASHGRLPTRTDLSFFPVGQSVFVAQGLDLIAWLSIPLQLALGFPTYFNVLVILLLTLNGYCGYRLFHHITRDVCVGGLCGAFLATSPYVCLELRDGHLDSAAVFVPCLAMLYMLKTAREENSRNPWLLGIFFLLSTAVYYFFAVFLAMFGVLLGFWEQFGPNGPLKGPQVARIQTAALILACPLLPLGAYYAWQGTHGHASVAFFHAFSLQQAQVPNSMPGLLLRNSCNLTFPLAPELRAPFPAYIGVLLLLALGGLFLPPARSGFWVICSVYFYLLCLGPCIRERHRFTHLVPNPLYLGLYHWLPFFSRFLYPGRIAFFVEVSACALGGLFLAHVRRRLSRHTGMQIALISGFAVLYVADLAVHGYAPLPVSRLAISPFYHTLAHLPGEALVDLPVGESASACVYQIVHHKKLLGGQAEDAPFLYSASYRNFLLTQPMVAYLANLNRYPAPPYPLTQRDVERLMRVGFRYLVVHPAYYFLVRPPQVAREVIKRTLTSLTRHFGPPLYVDTNIRVFRICVRP